MRAAVRPRRPRREWTAEDADELRRLRSEGLTWPEIAERMGVSHGAMRATAQRLGIAERRGEE